MNTSRNSARLGLSLVTAAAIVLGAGVSGAAASNGPGRSGDAHAEHGHPNPDAVRGHDEEGKRGKGHESHGNGHGYGHGDHGDHVETPASGERGEIEIVVIDEPAIDEQAPNQPAQDERADDDIQFGQIQPSVEPVVSEERPSSTKDVPVAAEFTSPTPEVIVVSTAAVDKAEPAATPGTVTAEITSGAGAAGAILRHC